MPSEEIVSAGLPRFAHPKSDLAEFTDRLSQAWGVGAGAPAAQYIAWSASSGLFLAISKAGSATIENLCAATILSEDGVDSLLPILMALGLIAGNREGRYSLTTLAEEYFLPASPYYVGAGLFWGCEMPIPAAYLQAGVAGNQKKATPAPLPPASELLRIQLSRNLAAGVCAARSGRFLGVQHLVDVGGGAGAIAIPFALENPGARVTLVDLPEKAGGIRELVHSYNLEEKIRVQAMDVFAHPWDFGSCDAILCGNLFHVFPDPRCRLLAQRCFDSLDPGGRILLHEVLFDEGKTGPLIAALWNANMHVIGGRQRTASELTAMLRDAGFSNTRLTATAGRFSLLEASKAE